MEGNDVNVEKNVWIINKSCTVEENPFALGLILILYSKANDFLTYFAVR